MTPEPVVFILPCAVFRGTAMSTMFISLSFSFPLTVALRGQKKKARGRVDLRKHEFSILALWPSYLLLKKKGLICVCLQGSSDKFIVASGSSWKGGGKEQKNSPLA